MASKYPCKHGSHEQLKKSLKPSGQFALRIFIVNERSDNTCHQFSLFSSNAWLLSQHTQPNGRTNLLTNFQTWIALTGKMLGESSSGKVVLCSNTFTYLLILVIGIKMRVCALFRLHIESPIRSEKDFTSAIMFINWNDSAINFWQKNLFSKSWASKLGVRLICECGLYAGVYGSFFF